MILFESKTSRPENAIADERATSPTKFANALNYGRSLALILDKKMEEVDYSIETEEEFYEDFGGGLSDEKLNNVLIKARKNSHAELRMIVKELQYTRFLLKNIIEFVSDPNKDSDLLTIQKLVKNYVVATIRLNSKNL